MVSGTVLRDLRRRAAERGELAVVVSRTLRTWGLAESRLAELLEPRFAALDAAQAAADEARGRGQTPEPVPTIAFLASGGKGILVRLTVKASDAAAAQAVLAGEERHVRAVIDDWVFGVDDESMESVTLDLLREAGLSLGAAESLTAGYVAGRLAQIPGASEVLRGSIVSYASDVKHELLGVPAGPVISEQAALAMARGAARVLRADAAVATTGVAGPDTQEGQPVGLVCLAAVTPGGERSATVQLPGGRETVRELAVTSAPGLLRRSLFSQREPRLRLLAVQHPTQLGASEQPVEIRRHIAQHEPAAGALGTTMPFDHQAQHSDLGDAHAVDVEHEIAGAQFDGEQKCLSQVGKIRAADAARDAHHETWIVMDELHVAPPI